MTVTPTPVSLDPTEVSTAIASELTLDPLKVRGAIELIAKGNTIPFIARYRKEKTGMRPGSCGKVGA